MCYHRTPRAAARENLLYKTADLVARALREAGVRHAFGIPGGEVLELLEALRKAGVRFVLAKQELSAGFMADAAWQLTGAPGVLVATLGPGFTNTVTPVAQALLDRSAMIVITGEIPAALKGVYTHQILDQAAVLRPLTKWSATIAARGALEQVRKGIAIATAPVPGPVHFDLPADIASARQAARSGKAESERVRAAGGAGDFAKVVSWLGRARRPLVLAGLGVLLDRAQAELRRFVEGWRLPVITTYKAKGVLPEDHPLALGGAGLSPVVDAMHLERVRDADLVLCAGFDPVELRAEWIAPWDGEKRTVSLDLVPNTHHVYRCAVEYSGGIAGALAALAAAAPRRRPRRWPDRELERHREAIRRRIARVPRRGLGPYQVTATLREVFPRDTLATVDTGSHRILVNHVWRCYEPRGLLQSNGLGSMGYALPAAIAAKLLHPRRPVLAMTGEAGLDMVIGEMALLAHYGLALTIVVFRDDTLSLIKLKQERMRLPETGVRTGSPDYAALARAYGGEGVVVQSVAELGKAARAALRAQRFTLIEARIDPAEYRDQM
ncbi:MAG TPA: thiamine pyrophosphate-binding protein [Burkholderiales bacterium]|nr:thiamine pyrophosphate-binding protein [Burkholderiales bacterium]